MDAFSTVTESSPLRKFTIFGAVTDVAEKISGSLQNLALLPRCYQVYLTLRLRFHLEKLLIRAISLVVPDNTTNCACSCVWISSIVTNHSLRPAQTFEPLAVTKFLCTPSPFLDDGWLNEGRKIARTDFLHFVLRRHAQ